MRIVKIQAGDNLPPSKIFMTKADKAELLDRMDTYFTWLAGIIVVCTGLLVAFIKLTVQ